MYDECLAIACWGLWLGLRTETVEVKKIDAVCFIENCASRPIETLVRTQNGFQDILHKFENVEVTFFVVQREVSIFAVLALGHLHK